MKVYEPACMANMCCEVFTGNWLCEVVVSWQITQDDFIVDFHMFCNKEIKMINKNYCKNVCGFCHIF